MSVLPMMSEVEGSFILFLLVFDQDVYVMCQDIEKQFNEKLLKMPPEVRFQLNIFLHIQCSIEVLNCLFVSPVHGAKLKPHQAIIVQGVWNLGWWFW